MSENANVSLETQIQTHTKQQQNASFSTYPKALH